MTYAVRYYTKTGNTDAIAKELGVEALPISEPVKDPEIDIPKDAEYIASVCIQ